MRKICVFTGTRADYGLLADLMRLIRDGADTALQIIATNMHLSPEYGLTVREIEADGFTVDSRVEMLLSSDTPVGTVKSVGLAAIGYADALDRLRPDLIVILGDRYEMLPAAQAALIFGIPVAHLYGGDITEGAYDDAIRHAITKMSHLHFTATDEAARRVVQMGEDPARVFCVGSIGIDNILRVPAMTRAELEADLHFDLTDDYLLITFHPATMEALDAPAQTCALLDALDEAAPHSHLLFTLPNSDTAGRQVAAIVRDYAAARPERALAVASLGRRRYFSAVRHARAVVGNSSSGLTEVPAFGIPTLNIGRRQAGRTRGASVVDCDATPAAIAAGLRRVLTDHMRTVAATVPNPYYRPDTLATIYRTLATHPLDHLTTKHFHEM